MEPKIVLAGFSGHGVVVAEAALAAGFSLAGYADKTASGLEIFGLRYVGDESSDGFDWDFPDAFLLGVGDNALREKIARRILSKNKTLPNVIHPDALVSPYATFGTGNFVSRGVKVNPLVATGDFSILNTGCIVEHECRLGQAVHIAPGAVLAGNVTVGDRTFIGANAVVKQGVTIGSGVVIGAGAVVLQDVPDAATAYGNPARIKSR